MEEERNYSEEQLNAFLAHKNGYKPPTKKIYTGNATLLERIGFENGDVNKPKYKEIYHNSIKLVKYKYNQMVKENPMNKKVLKIKYEHE